MPEGLKELWCSDCTSLTHLPEKLPEGLKKLDCSDCTSLIFAPQRAIDQVGEEIVNRNYEEWRKKQCWNHFSIKEGIISEELIKVSCHPSRIRSILAIEDLSFIFGTK